MAMNRGTSGWPESSSSVQNHKGWLGLWDTNAPNKEKIHAWRMMKNGLAVGTELHRRRIKPDIFCPACGREETIFHRFWGCPHLVQFWKLLRSENGIPVTIPPAQTDSQSEVARWMLSWFGDAHEEERAMLVQALYGLWLARNEAREGKRIAAPQVIVSSVLAYVQEWNVVHGTKMKISKTEVKQRWQPPEEGWLKVNSDGAVGKHGNKSGAGAVVRDHAGAFRAATCHVFQEVYDPEVAEIRACKRAIQLATEIGANKLHLEMDSSAVVKMLLDPAKDLSASGHCVQEIKTMLQEFEEVKVSWVRRSANGAADKLAKIGLSEELSKVWFLVPPDCILELILDDIPSYA